MIHVTTHAQYIGCLLVAASAIQSSSSTAVSGESSINKMMMMTMDDHLDTSHLPAMEDVNLFLPAEISADGELYPQKQVAINTHPKDTRLRGGRELQENNNNRPTYSDEFVIPFELVWNMAFTNTTDLSEQPSEEDYQGLLAATAAWLTESINTAVFNTDPFDTTDNFELDRIDLSHFGASIFFPAAAYPSTVRAEVSCFFRANVWSDLPSTLQFLVAFSQQFDRSRWINNFMTNPEYYNSSSSSIFQSVTALQYSAQPSSKITATNESPESLATLSVSVPTAFGIDIGFGMVDREPTPAEMRGFHFATKAWLTNVFQAAYPTDDEAGLQFKKVQGRVLAKEYSPGGSTTTPAHTITYLVEVFVDNSAVPEQTVLRMDEIVRILENNADLNEYRLEYLHTAEPELSLFHGATAVSLN